MLNKIYSLTDDLSNKFALYLCTSKDDSSEEFAILKYGVFVFLQGTIAMIATVLFGILTNTLFEMVTISLIGALMKRNSGGVHCSSPNRCIIVGIIVSYIFTLIGNIIIDFKQMYIYILLAVILIHSFIILYKKCPVPCENKPLKKEEIRKKLRKNAFTIYFLCVILFIFNIFLNLVNLVDVLNFLIPYMILGLYMQTLSLTNMGSKFILFLDKVLLRFKI